MPHVVAQLPSQPTGGLIGPVTGVRVTRSWPQRTRHRTSDDRPRRVHNTNGIFAYGAPGARDTA